MFARNEAEDIVGAVKEGLIFAQNVWVIVDPDSTDDTLKILKETFGSNERVHVEFQIKKDYMQDDSHPGKFKDGEGCIAVHWNMSFWVNRIVREGEWFHFIAPDERYAPKDYLEVCFHVRRAMQLGFESVAGPDHLFVPDEGSGDKYRWCIEFGKNIGIPNHFIKKPAKWEKGLGIHTGYTIPPPTKALSTACSSLPLCSHEI